MYNCDKVKKAAKTSRLLCIVENRKLSGKNRYFNVDPFFNENINKRR